ncbi:MAG: hypothetical protein ACXW2Y_10340 [Acidimicrobiia bacterium]
MEGFLAKLLVEALLVVTELGLVWLYQRWRDASAAAVVPIV